tara:strand:+ start:3273 stop:4340 length:1068 start_codon:yes stop_codon:yes gene_type:complete
MDKKTLLISPPFIPLPPVGYAGIEKVVVDEAEGLAKKGWNVIVIAPTDSQFFIPPGKHGGFAASANDGVRKFPSSRAATEEEYYEYWKPIAENLLTEGYIIHDHTHKKHVYLLDGANKLPILSSVHDANPFGSPPPVKHPCLVGVSDKHANQLSINLGVSVESVPNGIHPDQYELVQKKGDYAVFFSRISKIKGVHDAISIARACGIKLFVAGSDTFVDDPAYVLRVMKECDGEQIIYLGEVSEEKKHKLLREAKLMLFPTLFDEPFGLVAIEAMACGTPVVASANGAMPQVIGKEGGIICNNRSEYVDAVTRIVNGKTKLSAKGCRRQAERFTAKMMVDRYEKLLLRVAKGDKW